MHNLQPGIISSHNWPYLIKQKEFRSQLYCCPADIKHIKSDLKEKVIPTDKISFEKKGVHPKKNSILNDEKNNEPDKKAIKSAKEWGQATNDPRKKTT